MLSLAYNTRIFLCREPTDMRLGYEGLRSKVTYQFKCDPLSGHLFVFFNKPKNKCKILFYDQGGLCLFCKRLEVGTFSIPNLSLTESRIEIDRVQFIHFLDGIIVAEFKRKKRFIPCKKTESEVL